MYSKKLDLQQKDTPALENGSLHLLRARGEMCENLTKTLKCVSCVSACPSGVRGGVTVGVCCICIE